MGPATILLIVLGGYLLIGVPVAVYMALRGAARLDRTAAAGSLPFRILILPGSAMLWPMLLARLRPGAPEPDRHRAFAVRHQGRHRLIATLLWPALLVGAVAIVLARPAAPTPSPASPQTPPVSEGATP